MPPFAVEAIIIAAETPILVVAVGWPVGAMASSAVVPAVIVVEVRELLHKSGDVAEVRFKPLLLAELELVDGVAGLPVGVFEFPIFGA